MTTELERIARELCQADGFHPDELVYPHDLPVGVRGLPIVPRAEPSPQWRYYEYYVKAVLDTILNIDLGTCCTLSERIAGILGGDVVPEEPAEVSEAVVDAILPNWRVKMGLV
jgi:hypothetical protein